MAKDLYSVLGVDKQADADAIKKAYRKLASQLHPDKNPGDKAIEQRFKEINHANDVLSDAKKRALYDEFGEDGLREGFDAEQQRAYRAYQQQGGGRRGGGGVRIEDLFGQQGIGDIFDDLLGGGRRRGGGGRRRNTKGADLEGEVTIDFAASVTGTTLQLAPRNAGGEPVGVRIPAGAEDGSRVRVVGHGAPGAGEGATAGDLILTLHVRAHPYFRREEDDLHLDLPLTLVEAFHGAKVRVPTFDGGVTMKVPPHVTAGQKMRLKGKGVVRKGRDPGDLYVHFQIVLPSGDEAELAKAIDAVGKFQTDDPREKIVV